MIKPHILSAPAVYLLRWQGIFALSWAILVLGTYFAWMNSALWNTALALWPFFLLFTLICAGVPMLARFLCRERPDQAVWMVCLFFLLPALVAITGVGGARIPDRLLQSGASALILLSAFGLGCRLISRLAPQVPSSLWRILIIMALGLGGLSLLVLMLGLLGGLTRAVTISLLLLIIVGNGRIVLLEVRRFLSVIWGTSREYTRLELILLACLFLGLLLPLPAVFLPPLDYDVTEYHAQLPREYVEAGRIRFLAYNLFSAMPQNMEMLTTLAFSLFGGREGWPAAKLIHWSFLPLLLLTAMACAHRLGGRSSALMAGLVLLSMPIVSFRAVTLYVELGLCFYGLLALALLHHPEGEGLTGWRRPFLAGLLLGLASGVKYPALLFMVIPVGGLFLFQQRRAGRRQIFSTGFWLLAGLGVTFGPWLLRNGIEIGNPVAPLLNGWFPVEGWDEVLEERFRRAHRSDDFGLTAFVNAFSLLTVSSRELFPSGWLFLGFLPSLLLRSSASMRREVTALLVVSGAGMIFWYLFTHRIERFFLFPFIVISLSGASAWAVQPRGVLRNIGLLLLAALYALVLMVVGLGIYMFPAEGQAPSVAMGVKSPEVFLEEDFSFRISRYLSGLPAGSRVLLVGCATPFHLPDGVRYSVVFSRHPLEEMLEKAGDATALAEQFEREGITHLAFSWSELARLHATYYQAYAFSPEKQRVFRTFLAENTEPSSPMDFRFALPGCWPHWPDPAPLLPPVALEDYRQYLARFGSGRQGLSMEQSYLLARPWLSAVCGGGMNAGYLSALWSEWSVLMAPGLLGEAPPLGRFPQELFEIRREGPQRLTPVDQE